MRQSAEFDIVVYGATGYTGRLVAEYLHKTYGDSPVTWAMAGRSSSKLVEVRDAMGLPIDTPLLTANADVPNELATLVAQAKCIITTVGPYQLYGSALVAECAAQGTDYVDLSGEPLWMRDMIQKNSKAAEESGARIVFSCGFDSIPFDLGVYHLQQNVESPMTHVSTRVQAMNGGFSGGTAASLTTTMKAISDDPSLFEHLIDPFCLCEGLTGANQPDMNTVKQDDLTGQWAAPFVMAPINTKNVLRTNKLLANAYGEDFCYDELLLTGAGEEGKTAAEFMATVDFFGDAPKPGEGPTKEEREAGNYDLLIFGRSTADGDKEITVRVTGDKDPGYGSTSKMLSESALCLIQDCKELGGGIYTPASAMGRILIQRLVANAGMTFDVV